MTPQPTDLDHTPIRSVDDVAVVADRLGLTPRSSTSPTWDGPGLALRVSHGAGPLKVQVLVHADHDHNRDSWDAVFHYDSPRYALGWLLAAVIEARTGHDPAGEVPA